MPTRVGENVLGRGAGKSVMPLRFMAFVLAAFVGWTAELGATLVVAYRSSDGIVVAADSLRTLVNSRTGQRGQVTACKVREFGDIVFAAAGVSHAAGPFSLDAITVDLRQEGVPLWDRIRRFDHRTEVAFNEAHNGKPETGPAFFTYILGFMLEGRPFAYTREFRSSGGDVEIGAREDLPEGEVIFMGQPDIVDHLSSVSIPDGVGDLERPSRQDIVAVLVATIDRQAERMPTKVGGPVDAIVLTANGTEWVHREPESKCPDRE